MSEEKESEDLEFPEIISKRESFLVGGEDEFEEIMIYPQKDVIFPFEDMTLEITDPAAQKIFAKALEDDVYVGITYQPGSAAELPCSGTIGVAAGVREIIKTGYGNLHLVKIFGFLRYRIVGYVETDGPFHIANVSYFEDTDSEEDELRIPAQLAKLRGLLKECVKRSRNPQKHLEMLPEQITFFDSENYSFFFWEWVKMKPDVRLYLLEMRSTYTRLICLNYQLETGLKETKPNFDSRYN